MRKRFLFTVALAMGGVSLIANTTLTETFPNVPLSAPTLESVPYVGDYASYKFYVARRQAVHKFTDTGEPAIHLRTWNNAEGLTSAYIKSDGAIEGGIKSMTFTYGMGVGAPHIQTIINNEVKDEFDVTGTAINKQVRNIADVNVKKNFTIKFMNYLETGGSQVYIGTYTWTPYLAYKQKYAIGSINDVYTNTSLINNLETGMTAPVFTSSNPTVAKIDAATGAVTGLAKGETTIIATSDSISTSYIYIVKEPDVLIRGYVRNNTGAPVVGCVVSNGFSVVKTDDSGTYSLLKTDSTEFVFISVPPAYEMPVDEYNMPLFYGRVPAGIKDFNFDFTLTPYADGGAADMNHVMIAFADPQFNTPPYEMWAFGKESITDMKATAASFPQGTRVYGVCAGDLTWDNYDLLTPYRNHLKNLGFPVFNVIGNHDHDKSILQDWGSDHYFKDKFGPTYYSVNRGNIHYVVLDNIEYLNATGDKSYSHKITPYQMEWLKQDLLQTPLSMKIVFLIHAPMERVVNRSLIYNMVANRTNTHAISGHHHMLDNAETSANFYDHILPTVGATWAGYISSRGEPQGYAVLLAGNDGFESWYFKATGQDKSFQMRAYPVASFISTDHKLPNGETLANKITANVWNYDSSWSAVSIYENGTKHLMTRYTGLDPLAWDFLREVGDTYPNYPGIDGNVTASRNPGAGTTKNMFYYTPTDPNADFEVEVTDRNGITCREKVLKNLMTASFTNENDNEFYYREDFNSFRLHPNQMLGTTFGKCTYQQGHTPVGWYSCGTTQPNFENTVWSLFNYIRIDNGSSNEGALYAYGQVEPSVPANNSPDRAMGSLSGFTASKAIHFGVLLENNTARTLNGLEITYTGEMWRGGTNPKSKEKLAFSYTVNPNILDLRKRELTIAGVKTTSFESLSFQTPATNLANINSSCDGNLIQNSTKVSGILPVLLYPGDVILLRWEDTEDADNNNALAIDDLTIKAITSQSSGVENTQMTNKSFYNIGKMIYFDEAPMSEVTLYNSTGQFISKFNVSKNTLDLSSLQHGIFFLQTRFGTKKLKF